MATSERSIGELLTDITRELSTLVREEVALAKREIQQTISRATKDVAFVVVGGFVAYTGLLVLIAAAVIGLAYAVAPWLSALIIGGAITVIGVILLMRGVQQLKNLSPAPERTARSVKEDAKTIKENLP